jgi:MarR family transcriptional regulator for hemolysin
MAKDCGEDMAISGRTLSLKLAVITRQIRKRFDQSVVDIGVTRSQWTLVAVISRRPGATQREVAEILEMSQASAGRLIDRLCADGLLDRRPKEDDRRAHCIYLTEAAGTILEKISLAAAVHENAVFAGFSPADLDKLGVYLDMISANIAAPRQGG